LGFRVIDVGRDNGATTGDFGADEFRGDRIFDFRFSIFDWFGAGMAMAEVVSREAGSFTGRAGTPRSPCFSNGDEFHLGGDDALACIPKLGHGVTGTTAHRLSEFLNS